MLQSWRAKPGGRVDSFGCGGGGCDWLLGGGDCACSLVGGGVWREFMRMFWRSMASLRR